MANPAVVGYRFRPNNVELIDGYLRPKNLETNTNHVDRVFNTLNISSFDPWELPSQSIMESGDQVWYYFGRKENKYKRGDRQIRKTKSGFWKKTGKPVIIKRKNGDKIGEKWNLTFHRSKNFKTKWVLHEYHLFSPNQVMMTYTVCKIKFKGEASEIYSPPGGGEIHEHNHSSITEMINNSEGGGGLSTGSDVGTLFECPQNQELDAMLAVIGNMSNDEWNSSLSDYDYEEQRKKIMLMQENRNDHRPKKPNTGVFIGYSTDDDSDSITATTGSIQTSSTCDDSFGSSNHHVDQITNLQEFPDSTIEKMSQFPSQEAEIGENKLVEKIKNKRAGFFYKIIQKFIKKIQLCASI